jgi:hypothetical protein
LLNFFERKESGSGIAFATGTWHADCYLESLGDDRGGPAAGLPGLDLFLMGFHVVMDSSMASAFGHNLGNLLNILWGDIVIHILTLAES